MRRPTEQIDATTRITDEDWGWKPQPLGDLNAFCDFSKKTSHLDHILHLF